jgi:hypothetical protein
MRPAAALLAILTISGVSLAFADPPATAVAPESPSTPAPNGAADDNTGQNDAAHTPATAAAAAATTPAVAPANPTPSTSDERQMSKQLLRLQGYKLSMRNGEEVYCRRETPLGSRLPTALHCVTVAEAELMEQQGRETTEHLQHDTAGCLSGAHGATCH